MGFQVGATQIWWLLSVLALYFWGSASFAPWRAGHACRLDLCMHVFVIIVVHLSVSFTKIEVWNARSIGGLMAAMFFLPAIFAAAFIAHLWLQLVRPEPEGLRLK